MDVSNLDSFRKQIAEAQTSIHKLYALQRALETKLNDYRELVRANANFLPDEERDAELLALEILKVPENIAEAVKVSLFLATARKEKLTPVQVKEQAEQRGFNFAEYTNPMASVHSILKRMKDANPPQASFDEKTGTYAYLGIRPFDVYDNSVYDFLNRTAWMKLVEKDKEKAEQIANETLKGFLAFIKGIKNARVKGRLIEAGRDDSEAYDE